MLHLSQVQRRRHGGRRAEEQGDEEVEVALAQPRLSAQRELHGLREVARRERRIGLRDIIIAVFAVGF